MQHARGSSTDSDAHRPVTAAVRQGEMPAGDKTKSAANASNSDLSLRIFSLFLSPEFPLLVSFVHVQIDVPVNLARSEESEARRSGPVL